MRAPNDHGVEQRSGPGAERERIMAEAEVIELSDDEDEPAAAPAPAPASGVIELSDDDDDEPRAAATLAKKPAAPVGTGDADAPLTLDDDDDDAEAARQKRQKLAVAACKLCGAARLNGAFKLATCSHAFCRACLQDFVQKKLRRVLASEVTCPTCAQQLTINDVQTLSAPSSSGGGGPSGHGDLGGGIPPAMAQLLQRHGMSAEQLGLGSTSDAALGARPVGSSVATRRLMKELQSIQKAGCPQHGFSVELPDPDNLYTWDAHFFGFDKGMPGRRASAHLPSDARHHAFSLSLSRHLAVRFARARQAPPSFKI